MKTIKLAAILLPLLITTSVYAKTTKVDGVPMNCLEKAETRASKLKNHSLASACRSRENSNEEHYTYCDGSGCTGFVATLLDGGQCKLSKFWTGQDDGDIIDSTEWQESCLVAQDFKSSDKKKPSTDLNSMKIGDTARITGSRVYQFIGNADGYSKLQKAEAVGKQIRREHYMQSLQVDSYTYKSTSVSSALKILSMRQGEFNGLPLSEIEKIETWIEDHSVSDVVKMSLTLEQHGGSALEDNFIFIPTESYEPILVINRFYYEE